MHPAHLELHNALVALESATEQAGISGAVFTLTTALGMERYMLMHVKGDMVISLFHNAPSGLEHEIASLQAIRADPIRIKTRTTPIPVTWKSGGGGDWRDQHAGQGYRSGIAAACWDPDGSGRIVMLSCSAESIAQEHLEMLMRYSLIAATASTAPLQRIYVDQKAACPLTERELECLLYAAAGIPSKMIARALGISTRTVAQYLERARTKLQVKNSNAAAILAIRNGWLDIQAALDLVAA